MKILASLNSFTADNRDLLSILLERKYVDGAKFGFEVATSASGIMEPLEWVRKRGGYALADLKMVGTPETLSIAVRQLAQVANGITISASNDDRSLAAAVAAKGDATLFGVATLTSNKASEKQLLKVNQRAAQRLLNLGLDGLVCSASVAADLRKDRRFKKGKLIILTPAIRARWARWIKDEDQIHTATVAKAARAGMDFIAVGRILSGAPDPIAAAALIRRTTNR